MDGVSTKDETMNNNVSTPKVPQPRKKRGLALISVAAILIVAVAYAIYMVATGRATIVVKEPSERVLVVANLCEASTIDTFNALMMSRADEESDTRAQAAAKLAELSDTIAQKANYTHDASCVFMRYDIARVQLQYATAKEMTDVLATLAQEGLFPSTDIDSLTNTDMIKDNLEHVQDGGNDIDD